MCRDVPRAPTPHTRGASRRTSPQSGALVAVHGPTWTHMISLRFMLLTHPVGLSKRVMTGVHHDGITHSIFTALRLLCALPAPTPSSDDLGSFYCLQSVAFSRTSRGRDHTACSLLRRALRTECLAVQVPPCPSAACCFSALYHTPSSGWAPVYSWLRKGRLAASSSGNGEQSCVKHPWAGFCAESFSPFG